MVVVTALLMAVELRAELGLEITVGLGTAVVPKSAMVLMVREETDEKTNL